MGFYFDGDVVLAWDTLTKCSCDCLRYYRVRVLCLLFLSALSIAQEAITVVLAHEEEGLRRTFLDASVSWL